MLEPVPSVGAAKLVKVFVASTRAAQPEAPVPLAEGVAPTPAYFRYVISIPPTHTPTEIEWPTNAPDPARHFSVVSAERLDEDRFLLEIGQAAARGNSLGHDVGIFVHGYNNSFQESLFRTAQLVADSGAGPSAVLFSWPSRAELTGYIADKDAVTLSRDALAHLVTRLAAERGVGGVKLVAHSMGSWLTMEAVRQIRIASDVRTIEKLYDVTLAAPDIDTEVFLQQLRVIGRLRSPITVLVSKEDEALSFSRFLAGGQLRAGAANIDDPRVISGARTANVRVVDISGLATSAGAGHDGFWAYSAIYGRLQTSRDGLNASEISAGVYVLDVADRLRPLDARLEQRDAVP
ncbi:alpha/beta hydrolase [Bradyrhizobium sp. LA6.1]|uniref:alpha/beta hydrolase n=1 Tax=Bradyrhizobium sp. LA6.1 TaxID=3156378 RepID=UPI003391E97A